MMLIIEEFITTGFGWRELGRPSSLHSQKSYRNHITQFENFLGKREKTASDGTVNDDDVGDYIAELKAKYAVNTVAVKVAAIKSYFKWLKKKGRLTHIPTIRSQSNVIPKKVHVDDSNINAIIQHLKGDTAKLKRDRAMLSLIALCGFKTEDVVTTNSKDVDFRKGTIKGQNMKPAILAVAEYAALRSSLTWNPTPKEANDPLLEPLFLNKNGQRIGSRSLRRHLNIYRKKAGLPIFSTRDLRNTWIEKQAKKNITLR